MNEINIHVESNENNHADITIEGSIVVQYIDQLKPEIDTIYNKYKSFNIELTNIEEFDLSGFQLLYSLRKTCEQDEKKLNVKADLPEDIQEFLNIAGFDNLEKLLSVNN